jgi:hypothetical protein
MSRHTNPSARPTLEALESRDVPSYLAAEFPGQGVWLYNSAGGTWTQLTAANASQVATDSRGEVVGEFPGQGVWLYNHDYLNQWQQLTANNAASLALGYSYYYDNAYSASTATFVVAEFPGQGLWEFFSKNIDYSFSSGWVQLTANNAATEAVDGNGHVVADFPGQGVWFYGTSSSNGGTGGWQQLTAADATCLAIGSAIGTPTGPSSVPDVVAAAFAGYGVSRLTVDVPGHAGGWAQLTASTATAVNINTSGDVVAEFPGWGVWSYTDSSAAAQAGWGSGWNHLTAADATLVGIDANGNVYGQFPGWGGWYDQVYSWQMVTANNASSFGAGG